MQHETQPLPQSADVIVLGAGAAGLMCAMTAAQRGRRVLVLEKANKMGKKILMSGGGRCNFTNLYVEPDNYISTNPHFCKAALMRYTPWDFIAMVEDHEISYEERRHSQLFCQGSAKEVLAMLVLECERAGVKMLTRCEVTGVEKQTHADGYTVHVEQDAAHFEYHSESLVVATGALSIPTLGGSGAGYDIARQFGLAVTPLRAGLVPLMFSDVTRELCERLSGLALEVTVSCGGQAFTENMLFTHRGLSGPAILQISNYWSPGDEIDIDLVPGQDAGAWLLQAKQDHPQSRLKSLLSQRLAKSLAAELQTLWSPDMADKPVAEYPDAGLLKVGAQLNSWHLRPSASEGYRTAEVTLGGVDTAGISSKTMEAKQSAGLYFIGEVVDVSGHLGGFNFQWAWSSGYSAGLHA